MDRRSFLKTISSAGAVLGSGNLIHADPAVSQAMQTVAGIASTFNILYTQAYIRDPSNPPYNNGYVGLVWGDGGIYNAGQQLSALMIANGIYGQNWQVAPPLSQTNLDYLTFIANRAHLILKHDFFTLVDPVNALASMRVADIGATGSGGELYSRMANIITIAYGWMYSDYAQTHRQVRFIPVFYQNAGSTVTAAAALGTGTAATGLGLLSQGGGATTLAATLSGEAVVGGTAAAVMAWTGVGLIVLGVGVLAYGAYRLFTQQHRQSGPWEHENNGDKQPYMEQINQIPNLWPPDLVAAPSPTRDPDRKETL